MCFHPPLLVHYESYGLGLRKSNMVVIDQVYIKDFWYVLEGTFIMWDEKFFQWVKVLIGLIHNWGSKKESPTFKGFQCPIVDFCSIWIIIIV